MDLDCMEYSWGLSLAETYADTKINLFAYLKVMRVDSRMIITKQVQQELHGARLDDALASLAKISKSEARRIIDRGGCAINHSMVRVASRAVVNGDILEAGIMEPGRFKELILPPEALLYEDRDIIAINKPAGINSQRTPYQLKGTLEYWVSDYFRKQGSNEPARVVHRLDRGTSGVMLFPKHKQAAAWLSKRFHDSEIEKEYLTLVSADVSMEQWEICKPIGKIGSARYGIVSGGKEAQTFFHVVSRYGKYTLLTATPRTGRTHQIRVHLESWGLPIVGDSTYCGEPAPRMMLHCYSLAFKNQRGELLTITSPLDEQFSSFIQAARL